MIQRAIPQHRLPDQVRSSPAMTKDYAFSRRDCARVLRVIASCSETIQRRTEDPVSLGPLYRRTGWLRFTRHDERRKRNADKRVFRPSASSQTSYALGATRLPCGAHPAGCARLSAFHRGSRQGAFAPFAQLQARLPGTRSQDALAGRALPVPPCPSPENAPPAPAVVPASMMPEAARVRGANPPAGTALAPPSRIASRTRPTRARFGACN